MTFRQSSLIDDGCYAVIPNGPQGGPIRNLGGIEVSLRFRVRAFRAPRNDVG
jgi:hypothetical protein